MAYTYQENGQQLIQLGLDDSCYQCGKGFDFDIEDDGSVSMSIPESWNGRNFCSKRCRGEFWFANLSRENQKALRKVVRALYVVMEENFSQTRDALKSLGIDGEFETIIDAIETFVNELDEEDMPKWVKDVTYQ